MWKAYVSFWKQARDVVGRTDRAGYWCVFLINTLIRFVILALDAFFAYEYMAPQIDLSSPEAALTASGIATQLANHPTPAMIALEIIGTLFSLAIMVPVTTLTARRLRDTGRSAAFAYPLPAIYLANAVFEFVSIPGLSVLAIFFWMYAAVLLVLCVSKSQEENRFE